MAAGCDHHHDANFDGLSKAYMRVLWIVITINAAMFVLEMLMGVKAQSQALKADALDFFADSVTYGISLAVIGAPLATRAYAAFAKGISLFVMGLFVLITTLYQFFILGLPDSAMMSWVSLLAFAANLISVLLLMRYKEGDANVRSVWLCSRNDMIGNVAVMAAAVAVWFSQTAWPDLIVALFMAVLFFTSSWSILLQSVGEVKKARHDDRCHTKSRRDSCE